MRRAFLLRLRGDRFRLRYRSALFRNAFSPLFYGKIQSTSSGSRITGRFRIHPLARAFAWVWFSFTAAVGAALFGISARAVWQQHASGFDGPIWVGFVAGPALIAAGVALLRLGRSVHVGEITRLLATISEGRMSSDEAADKAFAADAGTCD